MNDMLTSITLLSDADADGSPQTSQLPGRYALVVCGTFDGATVGLKILGPDGSAWVDIEDDAGAIAITANKSMAVLLPAGQYKATVSSAGASTSLYAAMNRVTD